MNVLRCTDYRHCLFCFVPFKRRFLPLASLRLSTMPLCPYYCSFPFPPGTLDSPSSPRRQADGLPLCTRTPLPAYKNGEEGRQGNRFLLHNNNRLDAGLGWRRRRRRHSSARGKTYEAGKGNRQLGEEKCAPEFFDNLFKASLHVFHTLKYCR